MPEKKIPRNFRLPGAAPRESGVADEVHRIKTFWPRNLGGVLLLPNSCSARPTVCGGHQATCRQRVVHGVCQDNL